MLRGYRLLIVVLGLILLGAGEPPKHGSEAEQNASQSELQKAATTISSAISGIKIPNERDLGCDPTKDDRNSDLCAQWKAANAARDAATYAWWTMLLGFGGTVLLVLTFWETRKTSRAELRAYIFMENDSPVNLNVTVGEPPHGMINMKNFGQTPAYDLVCQRGTMIEAWPLPDDFEFPLDDTGSTPNGATLAPGADTSFAIYKQGNAIDQQAFDAIRTGGSSLYIWGRIKYRDVFGVKRLTNFCMAADAQSVDPNKTLRRSHRHNDAT